jgi:hypothetical protein
MRRLMDHVDVQGGPNGTTVWLRKRLSEVVAAQPVAPR